ncbi:MAG: hypothetical protein ABFD96_10730 [Armatimonadia bacterium]
MDDNRVFNVNGGSRDMLLATLKLAFAQAGFNARAWVQDDAKGMLLLWWPGDRVQALPGSLSAEGVLPLVEAYLESDAAKRVECEGWDADADHDGHNSGGWRVYVEDWGRVGGYSSVICAIRPAFMWHGK